MKNKTLKKILAATLSTSMIAGMSMTGFAAATPSEATPSEASSSEATAPIYSYDVVDVVVPTKLLTAFNPDGLTVTVSDDASTSDEQIVSQNFGIVNKSTKNKIVDVKFTVDGQNDGKIQFVDNENDAIEPSNADDFAIFLAAVPADTTEVKVNNASIDKTTTQAALGNVTMTPATPAEVALSTQESQISFLLKKAQWALKSGEKLELSNDTDNDVSDKYDVSALAESGKGVTAFTFRGAMNPAAEWYTLTQPIKITAVYSNSTAPADATVVDGTGAVCEGAGTASGPSLSGTGITKSNETGIDYALDFTPGTALDLTVNGGTISSVKAGGSLENLAVKGFVTFSGNTVTISNTAWTADPADATKYIVVTLNDNKTITVKVTIQ